MSQPSPQQLEDLQWRIVGTIVGSHGVRGACKLKTTSQSPDWLQHLQNKRLTVRCEDIQGHVSTHTMISGFQKSPQLLVVTFQGITCLGRQVKALIGAKVLLESVWLTPPDEEETFWVDSLIGLAVVIEPGGEPFGKVYDVTSANGQDFLEIQPIDQTARLTIPFNSHFFPTVDMEMREIRTPHGETLNQLLSESL